MIFILAIFATISYTQAAPSNSVVYIIRHGEKTWGGGCLNPPGQERSNILKNIFNNIPSANHSTFAVPTQIFADQYNDGTNCERTWLTVEPLAQHLNLTLSFDHGHTFNGGNAASAAAIIKASLTQPVILASWEHINIQYLTADLGVDKSLIPAWQDADYDTVYQLAYQDGVVTNFTVHAQNYKPCSTPTDYTPCK